MLGEVDRRAEERRAMQAVDEPVDDRPRDELQVADACEHLRIDEPRSRDGFGLHRAFVRFRPPAYMPEAGTGTRWSNSSMSVSVETPSDSALKFLSTR